MDQKETLPPFPTVQSLPPASWSLSITSQLNPAPLFDDIPLSIPALNLILTRALGLTGKYVHFVMQFLVGSAEERNTDRIPKHYIRIFRIMHFLQRITNKYLLCFYRDWS
jgi:hypothetical protein